jgi:hypothetical protein
MSLPRPRAGFGRRFGYFMLAATAVWLALVGAILVEYGWEELQASSTSSAFSPSSR